MVANWQSLSSSSALDIPCMILTGGSHSLSVICYNELWSYRTMPCVVGIEETISHIVRHLWLHVMCHFYNMKTDQMKHMYMYVHESQIPDIVQCINGYLKLPPAKIPPWCTPVHAFELLVSM